MDTENDPPSDWHDVSGNFYMLNLWGFINFMCPPGLLCLYLFFKCIRRRSDGECPEVFLASMMFMVGVSYISQIITMAVMRWRHAGRVCSGDFTDNLHMWAPMKGSEEPYLLMTGSWLFYLQATHLYAISMAVAGISFVAGLDN